MTLGVSISNFAFHSFIFPLLSSLGLAEGALTRFSILGRWRSIHRLCPRDR